MKKVLYPEFTTLINSFTRNVVQFVRELFILQTNARRLKDGMLKKLFKKLLKLFKKLWSKEEKKEEKKEEWHEVHEVSDKPKTRNYHRNTRTKGAFGYQGYRVKNRRITYE